jgi:hypothetical protein
VARAGCRDDAHAERGAQTADLEADAARPLLIERKTACVVGAAPFANR